MYRGDKHERCMKAKVAIVHIENNSYDPFRVGSYFIWRDIHAIVAGVRGGWYLGGTDDK